MPSGGIVHEVCWSDAFPWWILFRAAAAAFTPTVIFLALLGAVALHAGWSACDQAGLIVPVNSDAADAQALGEGGLVLATPGGAATIHSLAPSAEALPWLAGVFRRAPAPVAEITRLVSIPFQPAADLSLVVAASSRIGWFVLVWSIFGTAISRCVALKLAGEEPLGPVGAIGYGSKKWPPAVNSVLFVLVGIFAMSIPGAILGLAMRFEWGLAFAGVVWPFVLLGAVVLAILAIGIAVGWPLMVAAVGVERADSFQAISTAFSYVYQRPLHYAFHAVLALVVAVPALAAAGVLADTTLTLTMWAASFGMGHERVADVLAGLADRGPLAESWGMEALRFWTRGLAALVGSFGWGYFWSIATASYLVLRKEVDGTELDEVVIDEPGTPAA
jgi:hypothetical protein